MGINEHLSAYGEQLSLLEFGGFSFLLICDLALWDAMTPPFRILDEFDVFMDAVNRKVAMKLIAE